MTVESATYIDGLDSSLPSGSDSRAEGDNHIRLLKSVLKTTFPNINGAVNATDEQLNFLVGVTSALQDQLNAAVGRLCEARLTAQTGVAVPLSDVSGATSLYFTPFRGNRVGLYYGSKWIPFPLTEISIDVPNANAVYDVFVYASGGTTPTLELVAWASDTARATALTYQDGILVKSGDTTRRYVGTIYTQASGGGIVDDTAQNRYLWNYYNRLPRILRRQESSGSWLYNSTTVRQANGNTANQVNFVCGIVEDYVELAVGAGFEAAGSTQMGAVLIGYDSITAGSQYCMGGNTGATAGLDQVFIRSEIKIQPAVGKHYLAWLEQADGSFGNTFYGGLNLPNSIMRVNGGMLGSWQC